MRLAKLLMVRTLVAALILVPGLLALAKWWLLPARHQSPRNPAKGRQPARPRSPQTSPATTACATVTRHWAC
jgi:hypothetical protein